MAPPQRPAKRPKKDWESDRIIPPRPQKAAVHIPKRAKKNRAVEIVFDPSDHIDYLTGFHKRKQQRRKEALAQLQKQAKAERNDERAERRAALKASLDALDRRAEAMGVPVISIDDEPEEVKEIQQGAPKVYDERGVQSTVTVSALALHSDEDDGGSGSGEDDEPAALKAAPKLEAASQERKKMTKAAHKTLQRTYHKIHGGGGSGIAKHRRKGASSATPSKRSRNAAKKARKSRGGKR